MIVAYESSARVKLGDDTKQDHVMDTAGSVNLTVVCRPANLKRMWSEIVEVSLRAACTPASSATGSGVLT